MNGMASAEERKFELERKKQKLAEIREDRKRREDEKRRKLLEHRPDHEDGVGKLPTQDEVDKILQGVGISSTPAFVANSSLDPNISVSTKEDCLSHSSLFSSAKLKHLSKTETAQVNFAPKDNVLYCKTTQTDGDGGHREFQPPGSLEFWDEEDLGGHQHKRDLEDDEVKQKEEEKSDKLVTDLSDEEKLQILASLEFQLFFERSSKIVERALAEEVDIFVDYSLDLSDKPVVSSDSLLSLSRMFFDDKWSSHRCVSGLDYSHTHPELLAVSYGNNDNAVHEPEGVVLLWNIKFKKTTPEYVFHSPSRLTSTVFARFHPNLLLAGGYSGQIHVWDNRLGKRTPANRSPLSTSAHTHPVCAVQLVGSANAHNLISVSNDGRLCAWNVDNLNQPQDTVDLFWRQGKQVASTCLSFPLNDVNNFLVGTEEGVVYSGCRHGNKSGLVEAYEGHCAPISGIDCHRAMGQVDFSYLFLTSSFDWTVKLWNSKESKPLCSLENHTDYVLDVAWSPVHPALFACVDAQGKVNVWNMNEDTESPAASLLVEGSPALNKLIWMTNGLQLAVGDSVGRVWLYDVHESLAIPKNDEWSRLARTLHDLRETAIEADELKQTMVEMAHQSAAGSPRPW